MTALLCKLRRALREQDESLHLLEQVHNDDPIWQRVADWLPAAGRLVNARLPEN